jgi:hypothetical protein
MAEGKAKKKPYHVMTVRLPIPDFDHLKRIQARRMKGQGRDVVSYTEIIVKAIREIEA